MKGISLGIAMAVAFTLPQSVDLMLIFAPVTELLYSVTEQIANIVAMGR